MAVSAIRLLENYESLDFLMCHIGDVCEGSKTQ